MNADEELVALFRAEVGEQLERLAQELAGEAGGWDPERLFRLSHNVKGASRVVGATAVGEAAHALEDLFSALKAGLAASPAFVELAREGGRLLAATFDGLGSEGAPDLAPYRAKVSALLAACGAGGAPAGEAAVRPTAPAAPVPASPGGDGEGAGGVLTLRVAVEKLDRVMGLASELVAGRYRMDDRVRAAAGLKAALAELAREVRDPARAGEVSRIARAGRDLHRGLLRDQAEFDQMVAQLQDAIRMLRMVPVDGLRSALTRMVREAGEATGCVARLVVEGGETEIDRAVLEGLRDPLVHILRNAVAHGIEPPADRAASGKPAMGTVTLEARAAGAWVEIGVSDDGRGVDLEAVRRRAVSSGAMDPAAAAAAGPAELTELIFRSGVSTAAAVSEVAGRGVGLDVVRENLGRLGGRVAVETAAGKGTRFRLSVPLTRLTTKGVLVRLGPQGFVFPIASVERTLLVSGDDVRLADGREVVGAGGAPLPLARLESVLGLPAGRKKLRPAVVVAEGGRRCAVLVDEVLGEREFVVQRLSWNLKRVPFIGGSTVLDEGRVCLIVDAGEVLKLGGAARRGAEEGLAREEERRRRILVADDSVTTRTLEKNVLAAAGYDVAVAVDGEEAWQKLRAGEVDLVVSDVEMPLLDGFELTRRIRADERLRALPVILVTGLGKDVHRQRGAEVGANAYIVKGEFDQEQLLKAVARLS